MYELARQDNATRAQAFDYASDVLGMNAAIIEKDYYVVLILDLLFDKSNLGKYFAFKGGTSLSKAYDIIKRFSEDIDLILDWQVLGYGAEEPWENRSKTAQLKFNAIANEKAAEWISTILIPDLNSRIQEMELQGFHLDVDEIDPNTVLVNYPRVHSDHSILPEIRLEIGPLAAWTPIANQKIKPYVAAVFPDLFVSNTIIVPTVEAKRTFWEKATILHKEANRMKNQTPKRYSRHYYDLFLLAQSPIKEEALHDSELLQRVVDFKQKFYADNSAKYDEATMDKIKLYPKEEQISILHDDYRSMQNMMFSASPSFDEILEGMKKLESELHRSDLK
jgi:predicted nucleotidyltransferase component of viral defense system